MFSIFYLSSLYKGLDIKILLPEGARLKVLGSMKNIDSNKGVWRFFDNPKVMHQ